MPISKQDKRIEKAARQRKLLYSDDHFTLITEKSKIIEVSLLEKTSDGLTLMAGIFGMDENQTFILIA
jgi:hypothetical protein